VPRRKTEQLTAFELEIMSVLWEMGPAKSLVVSLLETRHLTPEKLSRLNELLDKSYEVGRGKD
jgi:predicted transcriptional regulator